MILFVGLSSFPIYITDEARNAQAAWEMLQNEEWIVPTFNENLRSDKPPLHYLGMRFWYILLGKNALAARLGSSLCGLATVFGLFLFTRYNYGKATGVIAGMVYLVGFYVPLQYHLATPDAYLAVTFTLAMLALYRGYTEKSRRWLYGGYFLLGLAVLAKGPVAVVLAGLTWGGYFLFDWRNLTKNIPRLHPVAGAAIVLFTALPWYVAVHYATDGAFTEGFFLEHNLRRFSETKEGHGGSPLLVVAILLLGLLPFGAWLPPALREALKESVGPLRFMAAAVIGTMLLFSLSRTKLPSYPFPAFGFAAVIIAHWLGQLWRGRRSLYISDHVAFGCATLVLASFPVLAYLGLRQDAVLRELTPTWWHFVLTIPFAIYAVLGWMYQRYKRGLWGLGAGFFALHLYLFTIFLPRLNTCNQVALALPLLRDAPGYVALGRFAPAYVYALDGPIVRYYESDELAAWLKTAPDGALVLSAARFTDLLPPGVDLRPVFRQKDLFEYSTTVIYRYHANE